MNQREKLVNYIRNNWRKIPYLCCMSENEIYELTGNICIEETEVGTAIVISENDNCDKSICARMFIGNDEKFYGTLYGNLNISFCIDKQDNIEFLENKSFMVRDEMLRNFILNKTVATHFGDDLDNKSSIYAIENFLRILGVLKINENLNVERVPVGQIKEGLVNVDIGSHNGNAYYENGTIIIDGNLQKGIKSACQSLNSLGFYVPKQICELANVNSVSALDSRSGLALSKFLSGEKIFELAEKKLLDKVLTDEDLYKFNLQEVHTNQEASVDKSLAKVKKYTSCLPNGQPIVLAPEMIIGGSAIAYEMGIPYYVSINQRYDGNENPDGITFSISCMPGCKLPEEIINYGNSMCEKSSNVFVHPNGQLIVSGTPQNPNFKISDYTPEKMLNELKDILGIDKFLGRITKLAEKKAE